MKQYHSFSLTALLFLSLTSFSTNANALSPYKYNWTKIKSEHFTIIIDQDYLAYGELVAKKAEQAFVALQSFSTKHPKNTFIIIDHTKGFSNGSAMFFPYPIITLQPVTPVQSSSVGQYNDWIYELLVHEYTHILSFHNTKSLITPLRWVFGSAVSPNYLMPTWYQEGIAVFTETYLSNGGRLRSSSYQALQKELKASSISIANENSLGQYPHGSTPYVYGAWLNQDAFSKSGIMGAAKTHKTFSGRFPYLINGGYKKNTKKSLYKNWKKLFGRHKKTLSTENAFPGRRPKWDHPTKTLYFIQKDEYLFDDLIARDASGKENLILKARNILNYKIYNEKIYYSNLSLLKNKQDHQVFMLKSFDLKTKKVTEISKNENILGFDISDQGQIAFIDAKINKQGLFLGALESFESSKEFFSVGPEVRLSLPKFQTENSLLFSSKSPNKNEVLKSINLKTLEVITILNTDHIIGVERNLNSFDVLSESNGLKYLQNLDSKQKKQIHKGIKSLRFQDNNHVFVSRLSSKGPYIFKYSAKDLESSEESLKIPNQAGAINLKKNDLTLKTSSYSSFSKLRPHYIVPNALFSPYGFSGEFLYGLSIGSQDPLELNSYSINVSTDTITKKPSANFNYTSRHTRFPISFSVGIFNEPLSLTFFRESTFASLGSFYTFKSGFGKNLTLSLQTLWNSTARTGPNPDLKRVAAALNLSYNSSELRPRELAPRKGYLLKLKTHHYLQGTDYTDYTQTNAGIRLFFSSPLAKTHRLILGIDGQVNSESIPLLLSTNSLNQPYRSTSTGGFALRGLPTGAVFATDSYAVAHLEYRFPILNINWGPGLLPGFFKRITGALTADYGSMKGADFINSTSTKTTFINHSTPLYSAGGELIFEGKLFYHLPTSLQIGVYKFLNSKVYSDSPEIFVGFSLTGLPY